MVECTNLDPKFSCFPQEIEVYLVNKCFVFVIHKSYVCTHGFFRFLFMKNTLFTQDIHKYTNITQILHISKRSLWMVLHNIYIQTYISNNNNNNNPCVHTQILHIKKATKTKK